MPGSIPEALDLDRSAAGHFFAFRKRGFSASRKGVDRPTPRQENAVKSKDYNRFGRLLQNERQGPLSIV
jgi:hypothetical protein